MMKRIISIMILSFLFITISNGQTRKAYIKAAEEAMVAEKYYDALTFYNEALDFDDKNPEVLFKSAEAAKNFKAYELASSKYIKLLDTLENRKYPQAYVSLGSTLVSLGEYDKAITYLTEYITNYESVDMEMTNLAKEALAGAEYAKERSELIDKSADIELLDGQVNSIYSDVGPYKRDGILYFSSMQHEEENSDQPLPRSISKIHKLEDSVGSVIEGDLNDGNSLKSHITISRDGSYMIYALCEYGINNKVSCDLYKRTIDEEGEYGDKELLGGNVNGETYTSTHPHLSYDPDNNREILYFVSDREGGKGKFDIWYSVLNNMGELSEPINMSSINTEEEDAAPYRDNVNNRLYFSSNGRKGLGGYDIFSVALSNIDAEPEHLKAPVNSSYDDIYYIIDEDKDEGYFASNRASSAKVDELTNACCFDIYKVNYNDVIIDLNVLTYDSLTQRDLAEATVYLIDNKSGDTIAVVENMEGNTHEFVLKKDRDYTLLAKREFYDDYSKKLSTADISESKKIEEKIYMYTPRTQLDLFTFDNKSKEELAGTRIIVRNLTDGSFETIDLTNATGNDYHLYLKNGDKYNIEVSKFGYVTKNEIVDLTEVSVPTSMKRDVYLDVFEIEEYINTAVYFENDYPNPKSNSTNTDVAYGKFYEDFMLNKPDYIKRVNRNKGIANKDEFLTQIDNFFEGDVAGGYETFRKFMRALKKELELGRVLQIELKGYASPVADSKYNRSLSQRRVSSVRNEILNFENGFFRSYIGNNKLIIKDVSFGEEKAPKDVSDSQSDVIQSVYAVKAARERRVEIIKISDQ